MYKFGVRYYDPTLGRWTQQDPLGGSLFDPSTGNRYIYANDDPTNLTDPTGADGIGCAHTLLKGLFGNVIGITAIAGGVLTGWTGIGILAVVGGGATLAATDTQVIYDFSTGACN